MPRITKRPLLLLALCLTSTPYASPLSKLNGGGVSRRAALDGGLSFFASSLLQPAAARAVGIDSNKEGIVDTDAALSRIVRGSVIRGAQVADSLDEKWERFSDALRDKKACDESTGRRMYDNGFRSDGSRLGNPVLGALCKPQALQPLSPQLAQSLLATAEAAAADTLIVDDSNPDGGAATLAKKLASVSELVRPSFARAGSKEGQSADESARKALNFETYVRFRAFGELAGQASDSKRAAQLFDEALGKRLLAALSSSGGGGGGTGNRKDFFSPFPVAAPDAGDISYDFGRLQDALGALCVCLATLEKGGAIGHWEVSIPEDDDGSVVTVAVDDDATLGAQVLLREQTSPAPSSTAGSGGGGSVGSARLDGSAVQSLIRAVLKDADLNFRVDSYFLDPSTTKQSIYNPTQLLVSVSNISGKGARPIFGSR